MILIQKVEALLFASETPLTLERLQALLEGECTREELCEAIAEIEETYRHRGFRLVRVAGGFQFRTAADHADLVKRLWQRSPARIPRSQLETLAVIAYRQPITRAEIESLRGVRLSSTVIAGLIERGWVKVIGRKEVPGRPHLYATGKQFLIDFGLDSLEDLPDLEEIADERYRLEDREDED